MNRLPERPNLDHLKKQAKDLLAQYRKHDALAFKRFRKALPNAADQSDAEFAILSLRLHDAQSCIAREYGFASWKELKHYVEWRAVPREDHATIVLSWLQFVYAGEVWGSMDRSRPGMAVRLLEENPELVRGDAYLSCAIGDEPALRRAIAADSAWVNRSGGPLNLPPLVAVTHSSLIRIPAFHDRLLNCARLLLTAGADPNQSIGTRWPPASVAQPGEHRLTAIYGAAGQNRDLEMTRLMLAVGADLNDNESLYHSLENLACTRLLLEAGARITGTNALYRILDFDSLDGLRLLLTYSANPNEPSKDWVSPLLMAITRRRSRAHIIELLNAGADPAVTTRDGSTAYQQALRYGLPEIAELLQSVHSSEPLSLDEQFVAACARADRQEALRLRALSPDLPGSLSELQLRQLPNLAHLSCDEAVKLMVELGWPIATPGGDWRASALNHALFRGNVALTRFLLEHGASWTEQHGYGSNVIGTLGWASWNEPVEGGDWLGCAQALVAHGLPRATPVFHPDDPRRVHYVVIAGQQAQFSDEITECLIGADHAPG